MALNGGPIISRFEYLVNDEINQITATVSGGSCKTHDEYRKQCGKIVGLRASVEFMRQSLKDYEADYDEDTE